MYSICSDSHLQEKTGTSHISFLSTWYACHCIANAWLIGSRDTLQPFAPNVNWEPLKTVQVVDRGLFADPSKHNLFSAAQKVKHLTPEIGTEILGIDLRQLSGPQKDELYAWDFEISSVVS